MLLVLPQPSRRLQKGIFYSGLLLLLGFGTPANATTTTGANESNWPFLSTEAIGARQFLQQHPQADGRGTVIFILDSGVDVGVPGLIETSTGETKVIDTYDFSGQGDVFLEIGVEKSEGLEQFIEHPDGFRLYDYQRLTLKPTQSEYLIGYLDETRFMNSEVTDINQNGRADDQFGVLVLEIGTPEQPVYVAYIDTDGDQHIDDETPYHDYAVSHEAFKFRSLTPSQKEAALTFTIKILMDQMLVSFHFDDGGHGTHVAGIAAGYKINGQSGYHGIAPGAQIISLKIGDNTLAGNATVSGSIQEAFMFGARWSHEHPDIPVIFNLSYGMGAEIPGQSEIERFIDALVNQYPNLVICLSAGNLGPGITSLGRPAGCTRAFTTGAMLDQTSAREHYGISLPAPMLFFFSSRGGVVAKPDAVAPGLATATVPLFETNATKYGSSMASPQTAGAAALILSARRQQSPQVKVKASQVIRALKYGAQPLPGYTFLDQGHGVINVPAANQILMDYSQSAIGEVLADYSIRTTNPALPKQSGAVAYWRTAGYFPPDSVSQTFYISPLFNSQITPAQKAQFYQAFRLESSAPWLALEKKYCYLRGEQTTSVVVNYQAAHLQKPGLYTGKILAFPKDVSSQPRQIAFELLNTVIIPYQFDASNNYQRTFSAAQLKPGAYQRYFFQVPPQASGMFLAFQPLPYRHSRAYPIIYDPNGRRLALLDEISSQSQKKITKLVTEDEILPGIWEIVVYAPFTEKKDSHYALEVRFLGLTITPEVLTQFRYSAGQNPQSSFQVQNNYKQPFYGAAQGIIAGYQRTFRKTISDGENNFSYPFRVDTRLEKITFKIKLTPDSFQKFTNIAVNIQDQDGKFVVQDGMTYLSRSVVFEAPSTGKYNLKIQAARTYPHDLDDWSLEITENYYWPVEQRIGVQIQHNGQKEVRLYPQLSEILTCSIATAPPVAPDGFSLFGLVMFKEMYTNEVYATLPIQFSTGLR
ncbi:S8 family serine peptidase [candidate division KSB1 bacterium]|nr:S8 family serine peptidase [candidate division KSB1 bacterium]